MVVSDNDGNIITDDDKPKEEQIMEMMKEKDIKEINCFLDEVERNKDIVEEADLAKSIKEVFSWYDRLFINGVPRTFRMFYERFNGDWVVMDAIRDALIERIKELSSDEELKNEKLDRLGEKYDLIITYEATLLIVNKDITERIKYLTKKLC